MKKLIAMLLALVMLLALCACGQTAAPAEQPTAAPAEEPAAEPVEEPTDDVGEPVNLIFSIAAVPTDAHGAAQKVFKETLESISGGNMTVECYDSGTLYGQDTEHDAQERRRRHDLLLRFLADRRLPLDLHVHRRLRFPEL